MINRVSQLSSRHSESNAEFQTSVFGIIHDLFSKTFESFAPTNLEPALPSEILNVFDTGKSDDDELDGPVMLRRAEPEEENKDALNFGEAFRRASSPLEHVYEVHAHLYERLKERHQREENDAKHHPDGSILITHAYVGFPDAQKDIECVIAGMTGKNVRPMTWDAKWLTSLEQYCQCKWIKPRKLLVSEFAHCQNKCSQYLMSKGYVFA